MKPLKHIALLVKKDALHEIKSGGAIISMLTFSLLIVVLFSFAMGQALSSNKELGASVLWVTILFTSTLGLNYSFSVDKEHGGIQAIMLTPIDRGVIYLGKMTSNLIFIFIIELFAVPLFLTFFNYTILKSIIPLSLILLLGTVGVVSVGTVFSGISTCTKKRDILLPLILFPIVIPVLIGAIRCTTIILSGQSLRLEAFNWITMLGAFDVLFMVVSFLVFEFILEEL
jgi:heme exporter protein B